MTTTDCENLIQRVHVLRTEANARRDGEAVAEYSDHAIALDRLKIAPQQTAQRMVREIAAGRVPTLDLFADIDRRFERIKKAVSEAEAGFQVPRHLRWQRTAI